MCVSTAPAEFTETILFLGKTFHPAHGWVFVLGYQNTAQNLSTGPNAMLLHLPATDMTQQNFLDTRSCRNILQDMVTAVMPRSRGVSFSIGGLAKGRVQIFEHDIYTVVLATDASLIPGVLPLVPAHKRITVNQPLFDFYAQRYPGYAVALCCFDNKQAMEAAPLLMWYKPMDSDYFIRTSAAENPVSFRPGDESGVPCWGGRVGNKSPFTKLLFCSILSVWRQ